MLGIDKNKNGSGVIIDDTQIRGRVDVVAGIDAGSTETRVCLCDPYEAKQLLGSLPSKESWEKLKHRVYTIPSTFAIVTDEREILSTSDNLEDNYDSRIIRVRSKASKPMIRSERVIRGQKMKDTAGLVSRYLDSSTNKMDNLIFYLNVLDGIGYAILQQYNGRIPEEVGIHLVLSVRPKELNSICQNKMDENFIGEYVFRWKDISIRLVILDTIYTTEPEAQISGTRVVMDVESELYHSDYATELAKKLNECQSYMHIEGGGSSVGVEVVKNGRLRNSCSSTFQLGGNYLTRVVIEGIRENKGRVVTEESAAEAVQTCLLRNGREREDITDIVSGVKRQVGDDILECIRHNVIDINPDLSLMDLDFITLGGRLFREDERGQSIATYFSESLEAVSPNTDVIVLADNYIPLGNMIIGINENTDFVSLASRSSSESDSDSAEANG